MTKNLNNDVSPSTAGSPLTCNDIDLYTSIENLMGLKLFAEHTVPVI